MSTNPLTYLDELIVPVQNASSATATGLGGILNNFTLWVVAATSIATVFFVMPVIPKAPANFIILFCLAALGAGIYLHYKQFAAEYRQSTLQSNMQFYGSITMAVLVIILAIGFYQFNTDAGIRATTETMFTRAYEGVTTATRGATRFAFEGRTE